MKNSDKKWIDMKKGDKDAIIACLLSDAVFYRVNAIFQATRRNYTDESIVRLLRKLKNDDSNIDVTSVGQFATASLDILGIEKYHGNDSHVQELITSKLDFS